MNKQHGLLFKMLCICLATVLMAGSMVTVSFADECPNGGDHVYQWKYENNKHTATCGKCGTFLEEVSEHQPGNPDFDKNEHRYTCILCGKYIQENHSYDQWADNGKGKHSRTCTVCGYTESEAHKGKWIFKVDYNQNPKHPGEGITNRWHEQTCDVCSTVTKCYNPFETYKEIDNDYHACSNCTNSKCNCSVSAPHDYVETVIENRGLFKPGVKGQKCWQCGRINTNELSKEKIPSIIEDIGKWIAGAFAFAGRVVIEPINWLVKLFTGSGIDDLKKD